MEADGVTAIINVVEEIDISDPPVILPILGSVTGTTSSLLSRATEGKRILRKRRLQEKWKLQALQNCCTAPAAHGTLVDRRVQSRDTLFYHQLTILYSAPKSTLYKWIIGCKYKGGVKPMSSER